MSSDERAHQLETQSAKLKTELAGFALTDCVIHTDAHIEKYLRRVERTALELAVYNRFGAEIGGFWLMNEQVAQLRKLPEYYTPSEAPLVAKAVEIYLKAQLQDLYEEPRKRLPQVVFDDCHCGS